MLLFNLFSVNYINSTLKHSPLNAHPTYLLNKGSFSNSIAPTNLNIFSLFFTWKFSKNLINLFPFSINTNRGFFKVHINIVRLSISWRQIFKRAFIEHYNLLRTLSDLNLKVFYIFQILWPQFIIYIFYPSLIILCVNQGFYKIFSKLQLSFLHLRVVINHFLQITWWIFSKIFLEVKLFKLINFFSKTWSYRNNRWTLREKIRYLLKTFSSICSHQDNQFRVVKWILLIKLSVYFNALLF